MAPIDGKTVDELKQLVLKLEARVEQLESKLDPTGGNAQPKSAKTVAESIRMILIGPPGAGIFPAKRAENFN